MIAAQKAAAKPRQSRQIKRHNETNFRRVEKSKISRVAEDLIVMCPRAVVAPEKNRPLPPTINYTSKPPQSETPAENTRSRGFSRMGTQEAILSAIKISSTAVTPQMLASRRFPMKLLCEMAGAVMDSSGEMFEYRHLMKRDEYRVLWGKATGKEIVRLAQGLKVIVEGTNTIYFINKNKVPQDRWKDVTYGRIGANYQPEKEDPYRIRLTIGGDRINYNEDCGIPIADLLTVKLLLNSIVSTPGAKFFTMDIKDFYLNINLPRYEYLRLKISDMPDNVIKAYGLYKKSTK